MSSGPLTYLLLLSSQPEHISTTSTSHPSPTYTPFLPKVTLTRFLYLPRNNFTLTMGIFSNFLSFVPSHIAHTPTCTTPPPGPVEAEVDIKAAVIAHKKRTKGNGQGKGCRRRKTNVTTGPVNRWHNYMKTKEIKTSYRQVKKQQTTGRLPKARPQPLGTEQGQSPCLLPVAMEVDEIGGIMYV